MAISFNGGKDCTSAVRAKTSAADGSATGTVLLHLYAAVLYLWYQPSSNTTPASLPAPTVGSASDESPNTQAPLIPNGHVPDDRFDRPADQQPSPTDGTNVGRSHAQINGRTHAPPTLLESSTFRTTDQPTSSSATHHHPPASASTSRSRLPYPPIKSIYITASDPFPALETFVMDSTERYGLDLYRFGGGMKAALEEYLHCRGGKGVKGVLVGTRRGDPNGGM